MHRSICYIFNTLTALSGLMCVALIALWIGNVPSGPAVVRIIGPIRASIFGRSVSLHNQPLPYSGSIISVSSASRPSTDPTKSAFDFAGIYYRHFRWRIRGDILDPDAPDPLSRRGNDDPSADLAYTLYAPGVTQIRPLSDL